MTRIGSPSVSSSRRNAEISSETKYSVSGEIDAMRLWPLVNTKDSALEPGYFLKIAFKIHR